MITTMPFKESTALEEKNSQNERGSMASTATYSAATKLAWLASGVIIPDRLGAPETTTIVQPRKFISQS
jgi:hypothetical protein